MTTHVVQTIGNGQKLFLIDDKGQREVTLAELWTMQNIVVTYIY